MRSTTDDKESLAGRLEVLEIVWKFIVHVNCMFGHNVFLWIELKDLLAFIFTYVKVEFKEVGRELLL